MKLRSLFLLLIALFTALASEAQLAVGSWKQYPIFGEFSGLIDTGSNVWYTTGGCLYNYDKDADETRFFEGGKSLTDYTVKFIRHYPEKDMLAVVFNNGNIDMILADGTLANLPDIKDAIVNVDKTVNDVIFDGDEMYVATGFGIVVYDLNRLEVKESGIYNRDIATVFLSPDRLYIVPSAHNNWLYNLMSIEKGKPINNFDNFKVSHTYYDIIRNVVPLNAEHTDFAMTRNTHLGSMHINEDGSIHDASDIRLSGSQPYVSHLSRSADGTVRFITTDGTIGHYTGHNAIVSDMTLPESFKGNMFSSAAGMSSVWLADANGLGNYRFGEDGSMTVLRDKSVPTDAISFNEVCNIFPTTDNRGFYICNLGSTQLHPIGKGSHYDLPMHANLIEDGNVTVIKPSGVSAKIDVTINSQNTNGKYIYAPICIAEDPADKSRIYIGTAAEGIYVVKDNEEIGRIDGDNSPMEKLVDAYWTLGDIKIDHEGNMWITNATYDANKQPIFILPASKRLNDPSTLTKADWLAPDFGRHLQHKDIHLLICRHSDMVFAIHGDGNSSLIAYDHNGTITNLSDDRHTIWNSLIDQDGKAFAPLEWRCMLEDKRGHVWIGTYTGIIAITDPSKACDDGLRINRLKVPRNDGSGLADYLLESDKIVAMAVDSSNRKWVGTQSSGLYLISENGDKILSHFTTENSPLPTNTITTLYADPNSSSIFVGTLSGLYEYSSTSGPSRPDYSNVYAYPNPVTPDYSGWITIAGLMESSLVKIMDSNMHLVYQTTSEGGTAMWDGCNTSGARVRSGVYYVLASSQDGDSSSFTTSTTGDVVAKILVVN